MVHTVRDLTTDRRRLGRSRRTLIGIALALSAVAGCTTPGATSAPTDAMMEHSAAPTDAMMEHSAAPTDAMMEHSPTPS